MNIHSRTPQLKYVAGHPVCMADALSLDFQPAVPKNTTCGEDQPPNCEPRDDGEGAAAEPSRMRALKTLNNPDHKDLKCL